MSSRVCSTDLPRLSLTQRGAMFSRWAACSSLPHSLGFPKCALVLLRISRGCDQKIPACQGILYLECGAGYAGVVFHLYASSKRCVWGNFTSILTSFLGLICLSVVAELSHRESAITPAFSQQVALSFLSAIHWRAESYLRLFLRISLVMRSRASNILVTPNL